MVNGGIGELSGCEAIMFGDLSVDVELRELDLTNHRTDASTEEEMEDKLGGEEEEPLVASPPGADLEN